ncbi:hypothetical protein E2C01_093295 [Portunus trituberculatus]|uniref:Uncharacterized protein n=1 Tax=Portunus trituberculatus TaxID=210409 RepID=A0A5B7JT12_PORTR|nr:hypothetical protein [Portunus trituberculatus]
MLLRSCQELHNSSGIVLITEESLNSFHVVNRNAWIPAWKQWK